MSAVGLTKAMRMDMERLADISIRRFDKLFEAGMATICADDFKPRRKLTPRGHAALAAPRMTQAELEYLEFVDAGHWRASFSASWSRVRWQCIEKRWIRLFTSASDRLTPSGIKALNDIRAATGSELWNDMP